MNERNDQIVKNEIIELRNIKTRASVSDWRESIEVSGGLLKESGYITSDYIKLTIQSIEELGPYVVLMPGLALAHARPDESVIKTGISLVTLKDPVCFDCENDPVSIVLTLACENSDSHLEMLGALAEILSDPDHMESILGAECEEEIYNILNGY